MNDNKEEQKAAELAVVEKISSEIANLIHDAEERTWAKVLKKDHYETYAVESSQMIPSGWELVDQPPVFFRRTYQMLPLAIPERGGSVDELEPFWNSIPDERLFKACAPVRTTDPFVLIKGWSLAALPLQQ